VGASVDDVHERHGQDIRLGAAQPGVERGTGLGRRGLGGRQRAPENRVRAEPALVRRPVELEERLVDGGLLAGVDPAQRLGDLSVDVPDRDRDALPVGIAQFDGLELAGRRS
jgi:hypothetical protein